MADSMLQNLLKTPRQIREEQLLKMQQEAAGRAQLGGPIRGASSALPGIFSSVLQQQRPALATDIAQTARGLTQGLGGMLGAAGYQQVGQALAQATVTPEERQAAQMQAATKDLQMGNLESMKQALKRLQEAGAPLEATLALSDAIAKREKTLLDRAAAARGEQLQRDLFGIKEREIELKEAEFEAQQILGGALGDFDLSTEDGVNSAVELLMSKGKVAEAVRLKNAYKKEQSAAEKAIEYFAKKFTNGDMEAAKEMYIETKRTEPLLADTSKKLEQDFEKATATVSRINTANDALRILDSGKVNIGALPKTRQGALKLLQDTLGLNVDDSVQRTELLLARVKRLGGEALASGMFGTGTAISDRDLITAMSIAGGDENLTPEGMEAVLKANMAVDMYELEKYNKRVNSLGEGFWDRSFYSKDSYLLETPEPYSPSFSIERAESTAQDGNGKTIYEYRGEWYNADGTRFTQ